MTVYELNKANYGNLPTMTKDELDKSIPYIVSFLDEYKSRYYLMLEAEQRYYTFFTFPNNNYNPGALAHELIDLASELGPIKSIEESGTMLEIWIGQGEDCRMYGFFDYHEGVIEVE